MSMKNKPSNYFYSQGTTLLEVMIAAFILGVGLVGIAALQMTSLQGSSNAEYRGRASDLAWSLADRMRANLPGLTYYATSTTGASNCTTPVAPTCAMVPGAAVPVSACTAQQMAAYDLWDTLCANGVTTALPGGTLYVTATTAANPTYQVGIDWLTRTTDNIGGTLTDKMAITVMPGSDPGL